MTITTDPARTAGARDLLLLTGSDAGDMLSEAIDAAGGEMLSWRPRHVQLNGPGAIASYTTTVRWGDGEVRDETFAACTGDLPAHALVLDDGTHRVAVWRFPFDPDLPGLPAAHDPTAVGALVHDLGLGSGPVRLAVRAYRPRRRAVVEAVNASNRLFIKAVRPDRVEQLHDRHRNLVAAGVPAPHSFGWTADGLLVLQALPGRTLRDAMRSPGARLPSGDEIVALLDRIPVDLASGVRARSWLDKVGQYAAMVAAVMPDQADRIQAVATAIAAETGTGPAAATHGDLYESQLLVRDGHVCGLLDIDTIRPGDRIDDLGCLIGHLAVLAELDKQHAGAINRLGKRYITSFDRSVDPADLRYRAAAVVVSLATGPHRVQQPKWQESTRSLVALAETWLHSARIARGT